MFTCLACQVVFQEFDLQRQHFQTEWHRYNLKRKVAELPPVTQESFNERVGVQKSQVQKEQEKDDKNYHHCAYCGKVYGSQNALKNHEGSNRHNSQLRLFEALGNHGKHILEERRKSFVQKKEDVLARIHDVEEEEGDDEEEIEEVDSDEWGDEAVAVGCCLFCDGRFDSMDDSLEHMAKAHSFFIPFVDYCINVKGLLTYLGEKVGSELECLFCQSRSRDYGSAVALKKHMRNAGHCIMKFDDDEMIEYFEFYDFSALGDDSGKSVEFEEESLELKLPSGVSIGHKSLLRYYRQRLNYSHSVVPVSKRSNTSLQSRLLQQYNSLGYRQKTRAETNQKGRDVRYLNRMRNKHWVSIGVKANKLNRHFRPQDYC